MNEQELRDPEYWKRMRDEFLKVDPDRHLALNWSFFPSNKHYFFRLHFKPEHQSIEADFSALAARAGRITNTYHNPTTGWFHLIATQKGLNVEKLQMTEPQTGLLKACLNGTTDKLSEISAILCSRYEAQMVEAISVRAFARARMTTSDAERVQRNDVSAFELYTNGGKDWRLESEIEAKKQFAIEHRLAELRIENSSQLHQSSSSEDISRSGRELSTITSLVAAERTRRYMHDNGWTQPKFASRAGMSERTLRSFLKSGKLRKGLVDGLCKAMKIGAESLLSQIDETGK